MIALAQQSNILDFPIQQGKSSPFVRTSLSNEWLTPYRYVDAAKELMGSIDLDPASCAEANAVIKAKHFYTKEDSGLDHQWHGRIWLNPPYGTTNGKSNQGIWARRLIDEYQSSNVSEAVLLITAATDMKWFQPLWTYPLCFVDHGIYFFRLQEKDAMKHGQGSCIVYLGPNEQRFIDIFSQFGPIAKRVSQPRHTIATPSLWEVAE